MICPSCEVRDIGPDDVECAACELDRLDAEADQAERLATADDYVPIAEMEE